MQIIILRLVASPAPRSERWWPNILAALALWHDRSRSRRQLAGLNDRELADIGLSRADRWIECQKRFWEP